MNKVQLDTCVFILEQNAEKQSQRNENNTR